MKLAEDKLNYALSKLQVVLFAFRILYRNLKKDR